MTTQLPAHIARLITLVLAFVVAVALTLGVVSIAHAGSVSVLPVTSQTGISVCGQGMATSTPDRAQITAASCAFATSAEDARNQAATAMTAVLAAVKKAMASPPGHPDQLLHHLPELHLRRRRHAHQRLHRQQ